MTQLFLTKDITEPGPQQGKTKARADTSTETITRTGKRFQNVQEVIGTVKMGQSIHYASMGEWSNHDLLLHLLNQTGPADVYVATWSVAENAIRLILDIFESGKIKNFYAILDWRVKIRRPEVLELIKFNFTDIRLTNCHAKTAVIINDAWQIAIVGSANFTNNPRVEAGVIACDQAAAEFHKTWIFEEHKNADPFDSKGKPNAK